jgi:hypothetical protein
MGGEAVDKLDDGIRTLYEVVGADSADQVRQKGEAEYIRTYKYFVEKAALSTTVTV